MPGRAPLVSPFIRAPRCDCCNHEFTTVEAERQADGSVRWYCRDIVACARRRWGPTVDWKNLRIYDEFRGRI